MSLSQSSPTCFHLALSFRLLPSPCRPHAVLPFLPLGVLRPSRPRPQPSALATGTLSGVTLTVASCFPAHTKVRNGTRSSSCVSQPELVPVQITPNFSGLTFDPSYSLDLCAVLVTGWRGSFLGTVASPSALHSTLSSGPARRARTHRARPRSIVPLLHSLGKNPGRLGRRGRWLP